MTQITAQVFNEKKVVIMIYILSSSVTPLNVIKECDQKFSSIFYVESLQFITEGAALMVIKSKMIALYYASFPFIDMT
jgi:hypothetical protein